MYHNVVKDRIRCGENLEIALVVLITASGDRIFVKENWREKYKRKKERRESDRER